MFTHANAGRPVNQEMSPKRRGFAAIASALLFRTIHSDVLMMVAGPNIILLILSFLLWTVGTGVLLLMGESL
ncbi:MAG: hypothetical protein AAF702_52025 [Chloroflexota bacterium]